jgi:hypothetical protein
MTTNTTATEPRWARHELSEIPGFTNAGTYVLKRDVTLVVQEDTAQLLDLGRGRFFALDPTGTKLVQGVLKDGAMRAIPTVAAEYGVPVEQVRQDWEQLAAELRRARLIEATPPRPRKRLPGGWSVFLLLTAGWICVRVFGWARTVRLWQGERRPAQRAWSVAEAGDAVREVSELVKEIASQHPLNTQCKERSLVGWYLLRDGLGLPAELVVGVQAFPFQAHAWVECGPWTVTDDRTNCETFTPAIRYR